ncbi:polysaccharide deacetylase [Deinococcus geothermalis DSM 11300]|uniref:Polysaccharide deacetylase n=1 Tax=Deinococcus geothermalis (strain DSM 11300 / CIP 105573 / AG-3a) TaxID=319795 RepID=Q1J2D5_DEIGD|nr:MULTISPECIES: polysaccharide deacetylase family protein [Deinococcus]ABF44349.1 polysaccharide deacetylase [Deinococcus geothermalis DSM 11300]MBI0446341.1 polysaccharide deacetylase [Deinococcus sp. DB0503]
MRRLGLLLAFLLSSAHGLKPSLDARGVVTHGPRTLRAVALTFDADMTPGMEAELRRGQVRSFYDAGVVQALENTHTPATFFLTGMWAQVYAQQARALAQSPEFEIENHSYDHPGFSQPCYGLKPVSQTRKAAEIERAQHAIEAVTGVTPRYFCFPGGCAAEADVQLAEAQGLQVVHWDVVGGDVNQPDPERITRQVLERVRPGSIVVLHVSGGHAPATGQALPAIIASLKARGYTLVTVQHLLGH